VAGTGTKLRARVWHYLRIASPSVLKQRASQGALVYCCYYVSFPRVSQVSVSTYQCQISRQRREDTRPFGRPWSAVLEWQEAWTGGRCRTNRLYCKLGHCQLAHGIEAYLAIGHPDTISLSAIRGWGLLLTGDHISHYPPTQGAIPEC
jgi:hypothetical protein